MIRKFQKGMVVSSLILIVVAVAAIAGGAFYFYKTQIQAPEQLQNPDIKVTSPQPNQQIQSPFVISGQAKGTWYFEASFPVVLLDANGNVIKQTHATAQGDWMTTDFVPFESILTFSVSADQNGTLVLKKDNPSGLPENDAEVRIPVKLKAAATVADFSKTGNLVKDNPGYKPGVWYLVYEQPGAAAINQELVFNGDSSCTIGSVSQPCEQTAINQGDRAQVTGWTINQTVLVQTIAIQRDAAHLRTVKLYYYNPNLDKDSSGNLLCSRQGLVSVTRQIPLTNTPVQDTIRLLIAGNLTAAEKAQGITTEYPLPGLSLTAASLSSGILTLTFDDPNNRTGGGSCRAGILWFQIEATAKQFSGVQQVRFMPEELFQP